jgi:DNA adenine methylase
LPYILIRVIRVTKSRRATVITMQYALLDSLQPAIPLHGSGPSARRTLPAPFKTQLLKWIGNKQRFAHEIAAFFPERFGTYLEPFLGSAAVLGTLMPARALGSDVFEPLVGIWRTLKDDPDLLVSWYAERIARRHQLGKERAYEEILASYNARPNPADFLYLTRTCYGGVVRFRKDGYMSTPCGVHEPVPVKSFTERASVWRNRVSGAAFEHLDYREAMARAQPGDVVYCDPPYADTQAILYGAQAFRFGDLLKAIAACKERGVFVALSHDGTKKSGTVMCGVPIPDGLFAREVAVNVGRSMLRRFQREGDTLEDEIVYDRLLLTV